MKRREILKSLTVLPLAGAIGTALPVKAMPKQKHEWTPQKVAIPGNNSVSSPLLACILSGHLVFLNGIGGWYANRRKGPGDIKVQIQSALTTMKELLENAGTSTGDLLKMHMTLADPNKNIGQLNEVYGKYFPYPKPVRSYSGAGIDQMGRDGIHIQIDCISYID